jgi:phosphoribosylanthranilate isomerase
MVKVKICGLTTIQDARAACECGADILGFVMAPSPRRVSPDAVKAMIGDLPPFVFTAGVFVDQPVHLVRQIRDYCRLDALQLHGDEDEAEVEALGGRVIKAVKVDRSPLDFETAYPSALLLLDTYSPSLAGGTGRAFDWNLAVLPARQRPIVLAGGLTPGNIMEAVRMVRPYAVDASSGVESSPGRKDYAKLESFIQRAKKSG